LGEDIKGQENVTYVLPQPYQSFRGMSRRGRATTNSRCHHDDGQGDGGGISLAVLVEREEGRHTRGRGKGGRPLAVLLMEDEEGRWTGGRGKGGRPPAAVLVEEEDEQWTGREGRKNRQRLKFWGRRFETARQSFKILINNQFDLFSHLQKNEA